MRPRWPRPIGATRFSKRVERILRGGLQVEHLLGEDRCEVGEVRTALGGFGVLAVDGFNAQEAKVFLALLWRTYLPDHFVPRAQAEAPYLALANVNVVWCGEIVVERRRKPKPSSMISRMPRRKMLPCCSVCACRDAEGEVLFLEAAVAGYIKLFSHVLQVVYVAGFEVGQGQAGAGLNGCAGLSLSLPFALSFSLSLAGRAVLGLAWHALNVPPVAHITTLTSIAVAKFLYPWCCGLVL